MGGTSGASAISQAYEKHFCNYEDIRLCPYVHTYYCELEIAVNVNSYNC